MTMPSYDSLKQQQGYTRNKWSEENMGKLWHSLFDYDRLSGCRQDDPELMSAAILLKKTFQLFKGVKQRCDTAEASAKQHYCLNCVQLVEENAMLRDRLREMEDRHKAVGRLLNLDGSGEDCSPLLRNPQRMQALTQAYLGATVEPLLDPRNAVKRKFSPVSPPLQSPTLRSTKKARRVLLPEDGVPETLPPLETHRLTARQNIVIPETLCMAEAETLNLNNSPMDGVPHEKPITPDKRNKLYVGMAGDDVILPKTPSTLNTCLESCDIVKKKTNEADFDITQTPNALHINLTPDKQSIPEKLFVCSPIIGTSFEKKRNRSFRRAARLTQFVEHTFSQVVSDPGKLNDSESSTLNRVAMSVGAPKIAGLSPELQLSLDSPNGATLDASLDESPSIISDPGFGRLVLRNSKRKVKENLMDRSNRSELEKNVSCMDTKKGSCGNGTGKVRLGERKQADYWQLKPTTTVQSISITGKEAKLKQTKLSLGLFPKKTDLCTLTDFNGGIRPSQPQSKTANDNDVIHTPSPDEKIASDLLNGLNDSDFLSPSPKVLSSIPQRKIESQSGKVPRKCLAMHVAGNVKDDTAFCEPPKKNEVFSDNLKGIQKLHTKVCPLPNVSAILPRDNSNASSDLTQSKSCMSISRPQDMSASSAVCSQANAERKELDAEDLLDQMGIPETPRTKELIQNFDKVPSKNKVKPKFKHQEDVVRKKDQRQQLEGWDCHECKDFYSGRAEDAVKMKMLMNKCSRHRNKNEPPKSPNGYWDVGFPSTQECRERNLNITQTGKPLRSRKKKADIL